MNRIAYILPATLLLSALTGCGSVVTEEASSSSAGTSGTTGSGAGGSSTTSSSGVTTGSGGAGGSCSEPNDALEIGLLTAGGTSYGCAPDFDEGNGDIVLQGQVHMISESAAVIDTCPPDANCAPTLATFTVKAENYVFSLPEGAYVELRFHVETQEGCGARLLITSLPEWGGVPNPVSPLDPLLLAASDGLESTFPEAPFGIDKQSVCIMGPAGGAEAFAFRFFAAGEAPGTGVVVPQGADVIWSAPFQKQGPLMIRNLRSFDSGFEDDYRDWSYLVVPALLGK